ncbi:MAG: CBS domain-containing protein, partial [Candidatus Schekmanbacteria bacterium]
MRIITSHINTDFDGFASMVAASKIYPRSKIVFTGAQEKTLREFLKKEGKDFKYFQAGEIDLSKVSSLVLVDVSRSEKLGVFQELIGKKSIEIHIYDHHLTTNKGLKCKKAVLKKRGATTTILVEILRRKKISLSKKEATLMAMGIYEETGCLSYSSTTPEDLRAAGWLIQCGADLKLVREYFRREINEEQLDILSQLLSSAVVIKRNNLKFAFATATESNYVDDAALVVSRIMNMKELDGIVALIRMDERIHLIFRSSTEVLNCAEIASLFGGGGHQFAASAVSKNMTIAETIDRIKEYFDKIIPAEIKAFELMTPSPLTISSKSTMKKAFLELKKLHYNAAPVVAKSGEVVGVINRKTLERAVSHKMSKEKVENYVNSNFAEVDFDTPAKKVVELMIRDKIPFLTVMKGGKLEGVITRSDLIK